MFLLWNNEIIAPNKKNYPPYTPSPPNNFLPVIKEKSCDPSSQTNGTCNSLVSCDIDMDCDSCKPSQGENYHCVLVNDQNYKLKINNSMCIVPKGKYCLPDYINKCNPNTSKTELISDGVRSYWSCKCKYDPNLNLFVSPDLGGSCDTQIACGNQSNPSNRLISLPRDKIKCIPNKNDPLCIQEYVSNYNQNDDNRFKYPLIYTPVPGVGYKYPSWDGTIDGPLVDDNNIPSWESSNLNPKCKLNPLDPSCNSSKWGGKCGCDGFVDPKCTDELKCQKYVPSTLIFKDQSSAWFKCMPDTCYSKQNPEGRLNTGVLGKNKDGDIPLYLKYTIGECDCGNIYKDNSGYKSFISKRIGGVPQCIKDPCNPGGYTQYDNTTDPPTPYCVCDYGNYVSPGKGQYCYDKCSPENNPCQNGSKCSVSGPDREVNCACTGCYQPPYCAQSKNQKGQPCNKSDDCCSGLVCVQCESKGNYSQTCDIPPSPHDSLCKKV